MANYDGCFYEDAYYGWLYGSGPLPQALWGHLMSRRDKDGIVQQANPKDFASAIGSCTAEEVNLCIDSFCKPDLQDCETDPARLQLYPSEIQDAIGQGIRLIKLDTYAYYVVEHEYYQQLARIERQRIVKRLWDRDYRPSGWQRECQKAQQRQ